MEMPMEAPREGVRSRSPRTRPSRPPRPASVAEITNLPAMQHCYDEAYRLIEQGLCSDEEHRPEEARAFYEGGMREVNKALAVDCENLNISADDKDKAKTIQQKMTKTKLQIEYRLQALKDLQRAAPTAPQSMDVELPSYEAAVADGASMNSAEYAALGDSIMAEDNTDANSLVANATEIFAIPDGVQIFYITPEGYVSAPSYPTALKIFKFREQRSGASSVPQPPAFLQVGDWCYPLMPGSSPALQTTYGAYLFPDVAAETQGSSIGLIIPDTATPQERQKFEELMGSLTMMCQEDQLPQEVMAPREVTPSAPMEQPAEAAEGEAMTTSGKISKGLITAAEYLSWGVGKGAEKAGQLISYGSTKLKARLQPEQPRPVDPKVQKGIQYVRTGSHVAVKVSGYVISKLGQATMALAREAAPHLIKQGEKLVPKSMKPTSAESKSTVEGVVEVAASGLQGFSTVFLSLEAAAKALGRNLANETVSVVSHKYGNDAGQAAENAIFSAGNLAMTAYNIDNLGIKAVAKRAAKDTGKAVLKDISDKNKGGNPPPPRPGGPPPRPDAPPGTAGKR